MKPLNGLDLKRLAVLALAGFSIFAWAGLTKAQGGQAFSISPPLIELTADPGQIVKATIKFTNISKNELLVNTQINDFAAKNESGEPNIIFEDNPEASNSLKPWVLSPPPFTIKAGETKAVDFPINVPNTAEPGGHYGVIRFTGSAPDMQQSGVALNASIGTLVLLRVSGQVIEKASVAEFFTANTSQKNTWLFEHASVVLVERIQNSGNVHIKPTGTLQINDMFGKPVATFRVNGDPASQTDPPKSILPDSIRRFEQTLDMPWLLGKYTATLNLSYGQSQQLQQTISFWVIPYKLIIGSLVGLIIAFFVLRWAIKKYNRYIIRKARS